MPTECRSPIYPEDAVILAPLSGFSDLPFRNAARRYGCIFAFTEMVDAGSLAYGSGRSDIMLTRGENEPWLGVQLVGANKERIERAVDKLNRYNFEVLDFNLGCPAPKVVRKGAGAALGADIDLAAELTATIVKLAEFPVTAKIRILDEDDPTPTVRLARSLEQAGVQAITIHGRIRKRFYSGPVFYDHIAAVRENCSIQIIGNGGIMDALSADNMRRKTGCRAVMVARGAMGNPWLFNELMAPETYQPPTVGELIDELSRHVMEMVDFYGEELAMKVSRKIILDYMRGRGFNNSLKAQVSFLKTVTDFKQFISSLHESPPGPRYWQWLKRYPDAERRLRPEPAYSVPG
jgi:tRNA-dihydrouridine synthase B